MYGEPSFTRQGWECPKCGRVYSPDTPMCCYCGGESKYTVTTTNTKLDIPFPEDLIKTISYANLDPDELLKRATVDLNICPCINCDELLEREGCNDKHGCKDHCDWLKSNGVVIDEDN